MRDLVVSWSISRFIGGMTALLVLEALDRAEIALTDSVQISPRAAAMKGSQALLDASAVYPLEDLLRTTIMASANDSAVALSEYIAGSEENFVDRMNRRAAELGMANTNYVNCTGYPQSGQYTTARDVCRLCCEIRSARSSSSSALAYRGLPCGSSDFHSDSRERPRPPGR